MGGRRAWLVWGVGVLAYSAAVLQRTTFGVAGIEAARHFGAAAGIVSLFVVLQLLVYALMQVPVGVLLDRFGSRALVAAGAAVMLMGQVSMAFAESVPAGVIARILVGAGDAMTFASVVRLVPAWFPARRVPFLTQINGLLGQSGQILSAVPFVALLGTFGWQAAFLAAAAVAAAVLVLSLVGLRDRPAGAPRPPAPPEGDDAGLLDQIRGVWAHPGTRLGMWTHFTTCFSPLAFSMMWGYPYLVGGQGLSRGAASGMLTLFVLAGIVFSPTVGVLTQRHPLRRSNLAFAVIALNVVPWVVVLAWPGHAPYAVLVLLMIGMASGGPGSAIGFDFARTFVPAHRLGTATGLVIMGGFGGALLTILLTGVVLDVATRAGLEESLRYRVGMATQLPIFAVGLIGLVRSRRVVRARMARQGVRVGPFGTALARRLRRD
ncbi:MFS transporter [Agilicoccus flavus]|uniref:MFS transporter n=1 Tax=Agilicoccus flavus TaxID=2775968 RepID=UPI001CF66B77|nr:MFS transporter [Agilicoccus flavus]